MPTTNNRFLTLEEQGDNVIVKVTYNVVFSQFERFLSANGVFFQERIAVNGVDENVPDKLLNTFPSENLFVTAGQGSQTITRNRSMTVSRVSLDEDPRTIHHEPPNSGPPIFTAHADEIRCRIEIVPIGLPSVVTGLTDTQILPPHEQFPLTDEIEEF